MSTQVTKTRDDGQADDGVGLSDRIAAELSRRVSSGELPLGTWLRQNKIAEEFGTSRTPVREAIQSLSATGIAEMIPNRGARIRVPSAREVQEGYRVRAELEGLAVELATTFATQEQIDRLRAAEELFEAAVREVAQDNVSLDAGRQRWTQANDEFHEIILQAARNHTLASALAWIHHQLPRNLTWNELSRDIRSMRRNVEQHRAIREAIEAGDAARARRAIMEHVLSSGDLILASLEE
ncbi:MULTISPECIES: GntR family transcriptional regulator [unclassified Diaminobutyricimonas]|uniref:GntR family transcriptional regulator n=1 Tax=unclassified Diaminobutyricimonas TaxID=2643261 RepID=UPI0012F4C5CA|nr:MULTISPECIES: GntR family transcriptional regulator [unclassified Diaminobutyricimonas]